MQAEYIAARNAAILDMRPEKNENDGAILDPYDYDTENEYLAEKRAYGGTHE